MEKVMIMFCIFHAGHAGNEDIQRCEAGNGMGDAGHHIVDAQHRVAAVILTGKVHAEYGTQNAEDAHEVQTALLQPTLAQGSHGNGDQLDAAKEKGQHLQECQGIFAADGDDDDFEQLKAVDEQRRPQQHMVFLLHGAVLVQPAQQNSGCHHHDHQKSRKSQMLPG